MGDSEKTLNEAEMGQVTGGELGGGPTYSWAELVCPNCHGKVKEKTTHTYSLGTVTKYYCANCKESFFESQLVEEQ